MKALVLAGGGAKGAFQVGVLTNLLKTQTVPFDVIYGTSVGALNAAGLSYQGLEGLVSIWNGISKNSNIITFNWKMLTPWGNSFYSTKPLKKIITKAIQGTPQYPFVVCQTNLLDGSTQYVDCWTLALADQVEAVLGSASIPGFMPLVNNCGDGGARVQTPLQKAIDDGATDITVILCNPVTQNPLPTTFSKFYPFVGIVNQSLNIMEHEVFLANLRVIMQSPVVQGGTDQNTLVQIQVYAPLVDLGDTLTFAQSSIQNCITLGTEAIPLTMDQLASVL